MMHSHYSVIEPSATLIEADAQKRPIELIERCGRICYRSEGKIGEGTAVDFVEMLMSRGHRSVLEHANFIIRVDKSADFDAIKATTDLTERLPRRGKEPYHCYLRFTSINRRYIISGNARAWQDYFSMSWLRSDYLDSIFLKCPLPKANILFEDYIWKEKLYQQVGAQNCYHFITDPEELEPEELLVHWCDTAYIVTDRGISHELVRHRPASFSQESTRYCNYAGKRIEVIEPSELPTQSNATDMWLRTVINSIAGYDALLKRGATPQTARSVLPTALATRLYITANLQEWVHILQLRTDPAAHPDMRLIMKPLAQQFIERYPSIIEKYVHINDN